MTAETPVISDIIKEAFFWHHLTDAWDRLSLFFRQVGPVGYVLDPTRDEREARELAEMLVDLTDYRPSDTLADYYYALSTRLKLVNQISQISHYFPKDQHPGLYQKAMQFRASGGLDLVSGVTTLCSMLGIVREPRPRCFKV